jgi:leucyl/phenylalanyl-tRNA--protein transferase
VLLAHLVHWDFHFVDCQVRTEHLERFGAVDWPRTRFLRLLRHALTFETRVGPWTTQLAPDDALALLAPLPG